MPQNRLLRNFAEIMIFPEDMNLDLEIFQFE